MDYVDVLAAIAAPPGFATDRWAGAAGPGTDPIHEYADLFGPVSPLCVHCRASAGSPGTRPRVGDRCPRSLLHWRSVMALSKKKSIPEGAKLALGVAPPGAASPAASCCTS